ncbi:MAG: hypothetical protein AAF074_09155 [Pseudomonadota bacterium]
MDGPKRRIDHDAEDAQILEGEILGEEDPGPREDARDVPLPGWVARNRETIERGREAAQAFVPFAPPPARLALIAASLAAEGLLTAEDARMGRLTASAAGLRAAGIVLDGLGAAAGARRGPKALVANARRIAAIRAALGRIDRGRNMPAG